MDTATLAVVVVGAAAAGFVQGLSGFAFGLVAMAFWAWTVAPQLAGPMVVFGSLAGQVLTIRAVRRGLDLRLVAPFIAGGAIGVPIGVLLLRHVDADLFRAAVGLLLVAYCSSLLFAARLPRLTRPGRLADGGIGLVGGVMGGLGGLSGPVPTLWCVLRGWERDTQRAVFQAFNLSMHALTMAAYAATGAITAEAGRMFALVLPAMLLPALLGARLYARFGGDGFRRFVLVLLLLAGATLLAANAPRLLTR